MCATLYSEIAHHIHQAIEQGTFREGDRIPSIRTLSLQFEVSLNTVKEAYSLLESQRLIEGRPHSGFFVRRKTLPLPQDPAPAPETLNPTQVSICRIFGQIQEKADHPGHSLALAVPDPELLPEKALWKHLVQAGRNIGAKSLAYQVCPGFRPLRESIAQESLRAGIHAVADDILITSGCSEAFSLAMLAVLKAGDTIAVESPGYSNFPLICEELGLKILEIPSSATDGLNLDVLDFALKNHPVKAVLGIPNFQNPLGSELSEEKKLRLVRMLEEAGVPLIEDDVYGEVAFGPRRPVACKSFDRTGNVIYCSSFSKTLTPGWRLGWVQGGRYQEKIEKLKSVMSVASPSLTQRAVASYLQNESYERHLRRLRQRIAEQMGALQETVTRSFPEGTRISRPLGGFVLWVELPEHLQALDLYSRAIQEHLVFSPGPVFSASGRFTNCLRLNAGTWNTQIEAAVERLGALCTGI